MPVSKKNQNLPKLWQSIKPQQSVRQFENTVIQFHNNHRTAVRQLPYVLGKRINLRKLYISVIRRGGYKRVNENNDWEDVLEELNLPRETVNCELAIQSIYHRYLEEYEREQWSALGSGSFADGFSAIAGSTSGAATININNNSNNSFNTNSNGSGVTETDSIDLSKHSQLISELAIRDKSFLAAFVNDNTPKTFCDYQHIINNSARSESGLSCDIRELHEFSGLTLSLLSGLANEIEFALNTLLIISNSHQIRFDLRFTGNLIDVMLATVGVFESVSCSYYEQFRNCGWMKRTLQFWNGTVPDGIGRIFLIPNIFKIPKPEIKALLKSNSIRSNPLDGSSPLFNNDDQHHEITDPCAHRVHLVATVLYNLTNDSLSNSRSIVNNSQFLRFLFLSIHSIDPVLRRLSLHILSKLRFVLYPINSTRNLEKSVFDCQGKSVDIDANEDEDDSETEWFSQFLLELVQSLLSSENRCDRIAALEMIQTLCLIEENHQILNKSFQTSFVSTISSQLLIPDIHPLCCALESLVSLSQLGEDMCRRMAMCQALLKILLQFIQIEAQMFGPSAVYKIKTFNHRPPIPMPTYHSLPQIMRFPSSNPLRQPFVNPLPSTPINNFAESNLQHQNPHSIQTLPLVSVANNYNSISTQGLSKIPLQNNIAKPHSMLHHSQMIVHNNYNNHLSNSNNNNSIITSNNSSTISTYNHMPNPQLYKASQQLTPLQQIDQLLTKSIASFENPSMKKDELNEEEKIKIEDVKEKETTNKICNNGPEFNSSEEIETFTINVEKVVNFEKKVVKIKCGIDGPDCEIGEINGSNKFDKEINGLKSDTTNPTKISTPKLVNGVEVETQSTVNGIDEAKVTNKLSEKPVYMNGVLEIDATTFDDPDRRQMPPPSLPTPSMLKKQMRPKLSPPSQVGVANGYLQQLNSKVKRKLVSEMTLTTNAQIEDRCDRAKSWLRQQYRFSDDSKLFVLKQDLVNDLHAFLFEDDNEESQGQASRRFFSAHELHSCIKDVFGSKVQVKVEHKLNGSSQLIYSNLCRILDEDSNKTPPNGIINPAFMEMNGFLHHSTHKKRLKVNNNSDENDKIDKKIKRKNRKHLDDLECSNQKQTHTTIEQMKRKCSFRNRKKVNCLISKAQRKLLLAKKTNLKASLKLKFMNSKLSQDENKINASASSASTSTPPFLTSQVLSPKSNDNYPIETYLPVMCFWGSCTERFSDENSLHFHLTKSHIPISNPNNMSMSRINCQWQHCFTASVPRAPLSLLSHVLQEHCYKPHISAVPPQNMQQKLINPMPYNIASPPSVNSIVPNSATPSNVYGQISEKSGWSVLHDHFRLDEQMQPHLPEGPITKHIRISSSIILRNMSRHSIITKEFLKNNESLLSTVAMSNQDCAPIIIQCLDELKLPTVSDS